MLLFRGFRDRLNAELHHADAAEVEGVMAQLT
jgi:hypothetical protein